MQNIEAENTGFLKNENNQLQRLLEPVSGLIYQLHYCPQKDRYSIPFVSKGLWDIYELGCKQVTNDAVAVFKRIHKGDIAYVKGILKESIQDMQPKTYEYRVVLPSKGVRWLKSNACPVKLEDGSFLWNGYIEDITDKKNAEKETRKNTATIQEQNKRFLDFAYIISHNLHSFSGNFEMLLTMLDETTDQEEKIEILNLVKKVSKRFSNTLTDLDDIVSVQTDINKELERINLKDYIQKTADILEEDIDQKGALLMSLVPSDIYLQYNPEYLQSILLNLISNALKYSHPDRNPEVKLEVFYEKGRLELQISDNGKGIDLDRYGGSIFGMYKTFHGNKDAVGIGLFITKNQIEAMGGEIYVESTINVGTRFKILFDKKSIS